MLMMRKAAETLIIAFYSIGFTMNAKQSHRRQGRQTYVIAIDVPLEVDVVSGRAAIQIDPIPDAVLGAAAGDDRRLPRPLDGGGGLAGGVNGFPGSAGHDADRFKLVRDEEGGRASEM